MKSIRYLILVVTTKCNLRCRYCYNGDLQDHTDITEEIINKALETAGEGEGPLHIQITGGEPTLVPHLVEAILENTRNRIRRPYSIGIQTNGTNLDTDFIKKLKHLNVQVGISIDGDPSINDNLRGNTGLTLKTMQMLDDLNVPFRVTTVINSQNVTSLHKLLYILAGFRGFRGMGLDLLVRKGRVLEDGGINLPSPQELRQAIKALVATCEAINKIRSIPVVIREQKRLQDALNKPGSKFFCHALEGESLAVMPDGSVFPCGQTAGDTRFKAGTLWELEMEKLKTLRQFTLPGEQCNGCPLEVICPGDCPSRVFYNKKDSELACVMYRAIWETISGRKGKNG